MGSAETPETVDDAHQQSELGIPGWHLWRSDADLPYATRLAPIALTAEQQQDGYEMTLFADTLDDLRDKIHAQPDCKARLAEDGGV